MERTLLTIEFDDCFWHVLVRGKHIEEHADMSAAIDAASSFARLRHDATGEPTGVKVPMALGEDVLVEMYG